MTSIGIFRLITDSARAPFRTGALVRSVLSVPLFGKLIGANVLIFAGAAIALRPALSHVTGAELLIGVFAVTLACAANILLVRVALLPIEELEEVAERVSEGEFAARARDSAVADSRMGSLTSTVNALLDAVAEERDRIQRLGADVIRTQDAERSRLSREIHDSIAQTLAAVRFQLSAATESTRDPSLRNQMTAMRVMVGRAIDDLRAVSETLYSRVAEDLGLPAALDALAAQTRARCGIDVDVIVGSGVSNIPSNVAATLFRVAQEGMKNVELHSGATATTVSVIVRNGVTTLEVSDNGKGFDPALLKAQRQNSGLSTLRDRVVLAGGAMRIESRQRQGTRIVVDLQGEAAAA